MHDIAIKTNYIRLFSQVLIAFHFFFLLCCSVEARLARAETRRAKANAATAAAAAAAAVAAATANRNNINFADGVNTSTASDVTYF